MINGASIDKMVLDNTQQFSSHSLKVGQHLLKVVAPLSPSWMRVKIDCLDAKYKKMFTEIIDFYEEFIFNFRIDFNREMNYTSVPIIYF